MNGRILVIDDEESVRDAFVGALSAIGLKVETAADGRTGLARAAAQRPHLIFLDLRMPGMDGVEVLRALQQPGGCCVGVPVCIVTAFRKDFMDRLKRAAADGMAFEVAEKPLTIEQIQSIARSRLEGPVVG